MAFFLIFASLKNILYILSFALFLLVNIQAGKACIKINAKQSAVKSIGKPVSSLDDLLQLISNEDDDNDVCRSRTRRVNHSMSSTSKLNCCQDSRYHARPYSFYTKPYQAFCIKAPIYISISRLRI